MVFYGCSLEIPLSGVSRCFVYTEATVVLMETHQAQDQPSRITLVIVDDHPVFRQGLRNIFSTESDIELIGEGGAASRLLNSYAIFSRMFCC